MVTSKHFIGLAILGIIASLILWFLNLQIYIIWLSIVYSVVYLYFTFKEVSGSIINAVNPFSLFAFGDILVSLSNFNLWQRHLSGSYPAQGMYPYLVLEEAALGGVILFFGKVFFLLSYRITFYKKSQDFIRFTLQSNSILNSFWLLTLLLSVEQFLPIPNLPGSLQMLLSFTPLVSILFFSRLYYLTAYHKFDFFALSLCVVMTIMALMFSYLRANMILPILMYLAGALVGQKSIRFLLKPIPLALVMLLFIFNTYFVYFGEQRGQMSIGLERLSQLSDFSDSSQPADFSFDKEEPKEGAFVRMGNLAQVSNIPLLRNASDYEQGYTLGLLVAALVPRFLWPDKPPIALGAWYALAIGVGYQHDDGRINNSINMTPFGHLYLEMGWLGLILGSFGIGLFINWIWSFVPFSSEPYNLAATILAGYLFQLCFSGIGADLQIIITLLATFLLFYAIFFILKKLIGYDIL